MPPLPPLATPMIKHNIMPEHHLKSFVANNMAAVGVTVCLLMVAMEMKTLYFCSRRVALLACP